MLSFQYLENWIGGTYYILNIIRSLNRLPDAEKPKLIILHSPATNIDEIKKINYPYLDFFSFDQQQARWKKLVNGVFRRLRLGTAFFKIRIPVRSIPAFYPAPLTLDFSNIDTFYTWIPDFQEHYLPQYFSEREIEDRKFQQAEIVKRNLPVVFSSQNALDDFMKFYPDNKNIKRRLRFASVLDHQYEHLSLEKLFEKFGITHPYFIVTNQFWKHKDHETAIRAFHIFLKKFPNTQLVLTGKEHDYRNPEYPATLRKFVQDNGLEKRILFLGFIDRQEQLKLMKASLAIVQPSLFEGWSTVVEDAKALNKFIILSGIPLHREQVQEFCLFFEPGNPTDLSDKMTAYYEAPPSKVDHHYDEAVITFARNFTALF